MVDISELFLSTTKAITAMPETTLLESLQNPNKNLKALWEPTKESENLSNDKSKKNYAYWRKCFENLLKRERIINNDHYEHLMKTNEELENLELKIKKVTN